MNGSVDDELRALMVVSVSAIKSAQKEPLNVWIDTVFNGGLVIPRQTIEALGLKKASATQAILADGQLVELETFSCFVNWFGKEFRTQVVANEGPFPLLGTMLLAKRHLSIDYERKTLTLE